MLRTSYIKKMLYIKDVMFQCINLLFTNGVINSMSPLTKKHYLVSLSGQDHISLVNRFHVNYVTRNINNFYYQVSMVKKSIFVDSVTNNYPSAYWPERETGETFGIVFKNHPDFRRLLLDYGFAGYPFRKDYSLNANVNLNNSQSKGSLVFLTSSANGQMSFSNRATAQHTLFGNVSTSTSVSTSMLGPKTSRFYTIKKNTTSGQYAAKINALSVLRSEYNQNMLIRGNVSNLGLDKEAESSFIEILESTINNLKTQIKTLTTEITTSASNDLNLTSIKGNALIKELAFAESKMQLGTDYLNNNVEIPKPELISPKTELVSPFINKISLNKKEVKHELPELWYRLRYHYKPLTIYQIKVIINLQIILALFDVKLDYTSDKKPYLTGYEACLALLFTPLLLKQEEYTDIWTKQMHRTLFGNKGDRPSFGNLMDKVLLRFEEDFIEHTRTFREYREAFPRIFKSLIDPHFYPIIPHEDNKVYHQSTLVDADSFYKNTMPRKFNKFFKDLIYNLNVGIYALPRNKSNVDFKQKIQVIGGLSTYNKLLPAMVKFLERQYPDLELIKKHFSKEKPSDNDNVNAVDNFINNDTSLVEISYNPVLQRENQVISDMQTSKKTSNDNVNIKK